MPEKPIGRNRGNHKSSIPKKSHPWRNSYLVKKSDITDRDIKIVLSNKKISPRKYPKPKKTFLA